MNLLQVCILFVVLLNFVQRWIIRSQTWIKISDFACVFCHRLIILHWAFDLCRLENIRFIVDFIHTLILLPFLVKHWWIKILVLQISKIFLTNCVIKIFLLTILSKLFDVRIVLIYQNLQSLLILLLERF